MQTEIKPNTCPYCGAAYTLAAGGCVAQCRTSVVLARLVRLAAEADEITDWSNDRSRDH